MKTKTRHFVDECPHYSNASDADKAPVAEEERLHQSKKVCKFKMLRARHKNLSQKFEIQSARADASIYLSTVKFLISGVWLTVDDAIDDSCAHLSVIRKRFLTKLRSRGVTFTGNVVDAY